MRSHTAGLTWAFAIFSSLVLAVRLPGKVEPIDPDEQLLRQSQLTINGPSLLEFLHRRSPREVDPLRLDQLIRQLGDNRFQQREEAAKKLMTVGPSALTLLRAAEKGSDQEIVRRAKLCIQEITRQWNPSLAFAVVRVLTRQARPEAVEALLGYLPHAAYDPELEEEIWFALDALTMRQNGLHP